jgi:glycine cleavage system H protein
MSENVPVDLKYAKSHEWVRLQGETAAVGITDHAQRELTDVVFVELPALGRKVKAGEACAVVESVKTASDIYAPVGGEVVAVNEELAQHPEWVNREPYAAGWFFQLKVTPPVATDHLFNAESYAKQIAP